MLALRFSQWVDSFARFVGLVQSLVDSPLAAWRDRRRHRPCRRRGPNGFRMVGREYPAGLRSAAGSRSVASPGGGHPMDDGEIRAALEKHWEASRAGDQDGEHQIYRDDAVLEYPQSGERIR